MGNEEERTVLKEVKDKLDASGISKREMLAAAIGACGTLFLTLFAGNAQAECNPTCVSCRDGCSNGPTK